MELWLDFLVGLFYVGAVSLQLLNLWAWYSREKITGGGFGGMVSIVGKNSLTSSEEIRNLHQQRIVLWCWLTMSPRP